VNRSLNINGFFRCCSGRHLQAAHRVPEPTSRSTRIRLRRHRADRTLPPPGSHHTLINQTILPITFTMSPIDWPGGFSPLWWSSTKVTSSSAGASSRYSATDLSSIRPNASEWAASMRPARLGRPLSSTRGTVAALRPRESVPRSCVELSTRGRAAVHSTRAAPSASSESREEASIKVVPNVDMRRRERDNLLAALRKSGWKSYGPGEAAELLGLRPTTVASRIKKMGIKKPTLPPS